VLPGKIKNKGSPPQGAGYSEKWLLGRWSSTGLQRPSILHHGSQPNLD
jgi:hypothetical protein